MNETPVNEPLVDPASFESRNQREKSLSDRILGYAFLGSIAVNIGWVALVSGSNLFGKGSFTALHEKPLKIFKPIPVKPKPKPLKPPPPPPKPKPQPQIRPINHPHPQPPRPVSHPVSVRTTTNTRTTNQQVVQAVPPTPPSPPFVPSPGPPSPPSPPVVAPPAPPSPPPPPVVAPPAPPPPPPPPPPVVHHPSNWVPIDVQDASYPDGLGSDVTTDGIDASAITNPRVVIGFTIDERGHFQNVHVKESSGSSELDNRYLDAIRRGRGTPAIQDHIPRDQPESISFNIG